MADDNRLSAELKGVQARLASAAPKTCSINSDQLMYRAGWAAATAQAVRPVGMWTAGSLGAALAAAVMLASMHFMPSQVGPSQEGSIASIGESRPHDRPAAETSVAAVNRPPRMAPRFDDVTAPLLAFREMALRNEFDRGADSTDDVDFASSESPASMHELRRELMPNSHIEPPAGHGRPPWQWIQRWSEVGETI